MPPYAHEPSVTPLSSAEALRKLIATGRQIDILLMDIICEEDGPTGIDVVEELFGPGDVTQAWWSTIA